MSRKTNNRRPSSGGGSSIAVESRFYLCTHRGHIFRATRSEKAPWRLHRPVAVSTIWRTAPDARIVSNQSLKKVKVISGARNDLVRHEWDYSHAFQSLLFSWLFRLEEYHLGQPMSYPLCMIVRCLFLPVSLKVLLVFGFAQEKWLCRLSQFSSTEI